MARGSRSGQTANLALVLLPLTRTLSGALFAHEATASTLYHIDN